MTALPARMLTAQEAAERAGVTRGTWTSYVARGQAPLPDERDLRTGRPRWSRETLDAWLAARPGKGARTDLHACGEEHCQVCAVRYGYTAVHFADGICAFGHQEGKPR